MTIGQIDDKFRRVNLHKILANSLKELQPKLAEVQRLQMKSGLNRQGKLIGKYKSPAYAKKKFEMNPIPGLGNVDLHLTGETARQVFADVRSSGSIVFGSANNVPVSFGGSEIGLFDKLVDQYGDKIVGLSPASISTQIKKPLSIEFIKEFKDELRKL